MTEDTFDVLIQRHEMGQAYVAITKAMGPSPQLLAFVNYDKVSDGNIGLESFDIMSQHEQVLADIEGDPSLNMATEALTDKVRKISDYVMKGGAIVFVASLLGGPLGGIGFLTMISGAIVKKISGLPTRVFSYDDFKGCKDLVEMVLANEIQEANEVPTVFTETAWREFNDKIKRRKSIYTTTTDKKVPVDRSGWSESNIVSSAKWLKDTAEKIASLQKNFGKKLEAVDDWVSTDHKGDSEAAAVLKYISSSLGVTFSLFSDSTRILGDAQSVLDNAAHLFEEHKK